MRMRIAAALFVLLTILSLDLRTPAIALDDSCDGTPSNAVMTLPSPLSKWGQVSCTPFGHVLTSHEGWVWVLPGGLRNVLIPSQLGVATPQPLGNRSYFTKIAVTRVTGDEFDDAYGTFHKGLDNREPKPDGYRVDIETASGKSLRLYFFDYDTYAWGMECAESDCDQDSSFAILDKAHKPQLREPSI